MTVIEANDVSCGYGQRTIIHHVTFSVRDREFLGIIGPNGSGKTTLLKVLSRAIRPTGGSIRLDDNELATYSYHQIARRIAVASSTLPAHHMTVEEFVLLGRLPHYQRFQFMESQHDLDIAEECMRLTGVSALRERPLDAISAGERQLVGIARALAQEPKLLILDEPTAHLDISHQIQIMDLVRKLNRTRSLTVIVVLHDLNLASEYCQALLLLDKGRIRAMGDPATVLDYRTIEAVYKTVVLVQKSPISLRPYVVLVSEEARRKRGGAHGH